MDKVNPTIEMYELDIEELDKFIETSKRPNLKRQLEEYKKNLISTLNTEKKRLEASKSVPDQENKSGNNSIGVNYLPITKYAFDGSGEKFVKYNNQFNQGISY